MRRIIWFNFFLFSVVYSCYGQVIIKDTIDIDANRLGLADEEPPSSTEKYSIATTIFGGAIKTNHAYITLISDEQTFVIKDCPVGDCYPPQLDFTVSVNSNSAAVFITYVDGQLAPNVSVESYFDSDNFATYKIWFAYSPSTWGTINAGRVKINLLPKVLPTPAWEHYLQFDSRWYDEYLDHSTLTKDKIGISGCALSCLAIILKAYGFNADPKLLNDFMKSQGFYKNGVKVDWKAVNDYTGNSVIQYEGGVPSTLKYKTIGSAELPDPANSVPRNLQSIDQYLAKVIQSSFMLQTQVEMDRTRLIMLL